MFTIHACSRSFLKLPSLAKVNTRFPGNPHDQSKKSTNIRVRKVIRNDSVLIKKHKSILEQRKIAHDISPIKPLTTSFIQGDEEDLSNLVKCL